MTDNDPLTMSTEREAYLREFGAGCSPREVFTELDAERGAHKRTREVRENREREKLRQSQEVSKALLSALKLFGSHEDHCPQSVEQILASVGKPHGECVCGFDAAIALAERPDALRPAGVSAEDDSGLQGPRQ